MKKLPLVFAIISFLLAIVIFFGTEGFRAIYSGLFFLLIAGVLLYSARKRDPKVSD
jgi:type IV secretory pathway TrbD component